MSKPSTHGLLPLVALLAALLLLACGAISATKIFSQGDSGSTGAVKQGEAFKVVLAENPATGYSWNMIVSGGLKVTGDRYVPPAQQIPGRGGQHEWTIKATGSGLQKITAIYARPWEPRRGNETTFMLNLNIQ